MQKKMKPQDFVTSMNLQLAYVINRNFNSVIRLNLAKLEIFTEVAYRHRIEVVGSKGLVNR